MFQINRVEFAEETVKNNCFFDFPETLDLADWMKDKHASRNAGALSTSTSCRDSAHKYAS